MDSRLPRDNYSKRDFIWHDFIRSRGRRYEECRFNNFEIKCDAQKNALAAVRSHVDGESVKTGNLILLGPVGCGKDHLLTAGVHHGLGAYRLPPEGQVCWISGSGLFSSLRNAIHSKRCESNVLSPIENASLLVVSDPLEAGQNLTDYQRQVWYRIVDHRYNNFLPIWMSINATGRDQMVSMLGPAVVDRLADGAVVVACDWPSHRKAKAPEQRELDLKHEV